ncbi:uncharacterized protein LOC129237111 [Anastrepha obliqua]|uniref:uncharacterized protein LOC128855682 n=1 Tax=Anastrepha ludens TaxID=28586 RepID=UPI0023AF09B1|nr:uncharacterized protein LOC128855682 [Anastrepha ludens]XP_053946773.1 uncharacterized protein LOC128855682 [Anastrepha ludens]XP_054727525.1 uncharacterized protein LOC129237111 [Anastrepha obliqua]XP_054727531.1 uncharacterized protein LOC129237111 [Anastrepha obliqua]
MDLNEKVEQLTNETAALRKEVAQLKESLTKQNSTIVKLIKEQCNLIRTQEARAQEKYLPANNVKPFVNMFPIKSQEELEAAEEGIKEENKTECIALARALLMPGSFKKNLNKILGVDVVMDYNVDGRHNKKRIQDYPKIMDVLFQATTKEGWNYKYFLDDLRNGFKCSKNKHFKYNWTQRRKHSEEPSIKIEEVLIPFDE